MFMINSTPLTQIGYAEMCCEPAIGQQRRKYLDMRWSLCEAGQNYASQMQKIARCA